VQFPIVQYAFRARIKSASVWGARICTALAAEEPRNGPAFVWPITAQGGSMKWETPSFTDMRFGFEITMYIATR
jgi:pyrroloquinoline quinone biosynthesis protein A